jgi:hypothetical protein
LADGVGFVAGGAGGTDRKDGAGAELVACDNLSIICVQFAHDASDDYTTGLQRSGYLWATSGAPNSTFGGRSTDFV